ncbi:MAG: Gfo/Idh/MocA family oxidoreductase [Acidobacteriota bacterium]
MAPEPETPRTLRVGVIGTGALGRHHARILSQMPGADMVGIHDRNVATADAIAREHGVRSWPTLEALAENVDAAVVAVPTVAHAEIGCWLLERGIHVLVEKPIASSLAEADRLLAAARDRVLAVGHVEFFNPAVQALRSVGAPRFLEVQRLAVFTPRSLDVDVVLDLMIHDIQILHALDPSPLREVRATGIAVLSERVDIANARLALESGCVANLTASRVSAERIRKLRAFLPNSYYSLDYQAQEIKGYRLADGAGGKRQIFPDDLPVERAEPLRRELEGFLAACRGETAPLVSGAQGRQALATALEVGKAILSS